MNANNIVLMKILNVVSSTIPLCHYQLHTNSMVQPRPATLAESSACGTVW